MTVFHLLRALRATSDTPVHVSGPDPYLEITGRMQVRVPRHESVTHARERTVSTSLQDGLWGLTVVGRFGADG